MYKENRREYEKKIIAVVQESWIEDEREEAEANIKDDGTGEEMETDNTALTHSVAS